MMSRLQVPDRINVDLEGQSHESKVSQMERQRLVNHAKLGVRNRRGRKMQVVHGLFFSMFSFGNI